MQKEKRYLISFVWSRKPTVRTGLAARSGTGLLGLPRPCDGRRASDARLAGGGLAGGEALWRRDTTDGAPWLAAVTS